jgi:immune inhibitor A
MANNIKRRKTSFMSSKGWITAVLACGWLMLLAVITARANPACANIQVLTQPDGTQIQMRPWGDEFSHGFETADGFTAVKDEATGYWHYAMQDAAGGLVASEVRVGKGAPPSLRLLRPLSSALEPGARSANVLAAPPAWHSGSIRMLFIMVNFTDVTCTFNAQNFRDNLFGTTATGPGNLADYYAETSYGAVQLSGDVFGPYTVAHDKAYYNASYPRAYELIREAILLANGDVDYTLYDKDGDGNVDNVAVIYAGCGPDDLCYSSPPDRLWPHAWHISPVSVDGKSAIEYFVVPELLRGGAIRTIGVFAHEFGHKLGLPDLYDTSDPQDSVGVGHWSLMGSGSWTSNNPGHENGESPSHMDPWSKWYEGYITPVDRTTANVGESMPQVETTPYFVRLLANPGGPTDWPSGSGEYFLLENRQQVLFDRGLDGCGILIWHIDESRTSNEDQTHRLVDLNQADGLGDLYTIRYIAGRQNRGDSGDPYPGSTGNHSFNDASTPSATLYSGASTGIRVNIVANSCADSMAVTFGNAPPTANPGGPYVAECAGSQTTVQLNGSGSTDPEGGALTYAWTSDCPGATFDNPGSATPVLTVNSSPGCSVNCHVTLTVTDPGGATNAATANVTVQDTTPPTVTCPANMVLEFADENGAVANFVVGASDVCSSLILTVSPASGSVFPIGTTTVTANATDFCGNSNTCTFTVEVLGARGVKQNVLNELVALRAAVTDVQDGNKLNAAIRFLTTSLAPALWVDQTHVAAFDGGMVFQREKQTVEKLEQLIKDRKSTVPKATLQNFIDRLLRSDRLLAVVAINEALAAGAAPKELDWAQEVLAKADAYAAVGRFSDAIEGYRIAWMKALLSTL